MAIRLMIDNPRVAEVPCLKCTGRFLTARSRFKHGRGKFCSRSCWASYTNTGRPSWNKGIRGEASHSFGNKHCLGRESWSKGKKGWMTEEHKQAIVVANTGRPAWNKGKSNYWAVGEKNVNWKGGVKRRNYSADHDARVAFRKSIQKQIFTRDNYTCQV